MSLALGAVGLYLLLSNSKGSRSNILNVERAKDVNVKLLAFLEWWRANKSFDLIVAPSGGLRFGYEAEQKQLQFYNQGNSNARTLQETPHGRGAALDLWPAGFNPSIPIPRSVSGPPVSGGTLQPLAESRFFEMGVAAENFGLKWGGRWKSPYDLPHIEVPNWGALPYPPKVS